MNKDEGIIYLMTKLGVWIGVIISPIMPVIGTAFMVIGLNIITGVMASIKHRDQGDKWWQVLSLDKLFWAFTKFFIYSFVIVVSYSIEKNVIQYVPWVQVISGLITVVEIKSISENVKRIYGIDLLNGIKHYLNKKPNNET